MSATLLDREEVPRRAMALTIHQPWATLIARGIKRVENRTWTPSPQELSPGEYLVVHAAKGFDAEAWESAIAAASAEALTVAELDALKKPVAAAKGIASRSLRAAAMRAVEAKARELLPYSALVGVARYRGIIEPGEAPGHGAWYEGPLGWALDQAVEIDPIELLGSQGLYELSPAIFSELRRRWHEAAFG